jgi:hypothetical protein
MYYKSFRQQFDSSIARDPVMRAVFNDLCALADRQGRVDMDYQAIAAVTRWPVETIVCKISQLVLPDPDSRSKELGGARLVLLDSNRRWGWRIVNYQKYRRRQYDDADKRRTYKRDWMRRKRAGGVDKCGQTLTSVDSRGLAWTSVENDDSQVPNGEQPPVSTLTPVDVKQKQKQKHILPPAVPQRGQPAELITNFWEAKCLICKLVLNGKDPHRLWSPDADKDLLKQLPMPRLEIDRVAWFRGLPDDGSPELQARKAITETGAMAFWGDEVTRANAFWQKLYGWQKRIGAA